MYRTPCVNKFTKYSCYLLTEQFLFCNFEKKTKQKNKKQTLLLFVCNLTTESWINVLGLGKSWNFFVSKSGNPVQISSNDRLHQRHSKVK